jgi:hypothetical protein
MLLEMKTVFSERVFPLHTRKKKCIYNSESKSNVLIVYVSSLTHRKAKRETTGASERTKEANCWFFNTFMMLLFRFQEPESRMRLKVQPYLESHFIGRRNEQKGLDANC